MWGVPFTTLRSSEEQRAQHNANNRNTRNCHPLLRTTCRRRSRRTCTPCPRPTRTQPTRTTSCRHPSGLRQPRINFRTLKRRTIATRRNTRRIRHTRNRTQTLWWLAVRRHRAVRTRVHTGEILVLGVA